MEEEQEEEQEGEEGRNEVRGVGDGKSVLVRKSSWNHFETRRKAL